MALAEVWYSLQICFCHQTTISRSTDVSSPLPECGVEDVGINLIGAKPPGLFVTSCLCWWLPEGAIAVNGKCTCTGWHNCHTAGRHRKSFLWHRKLSIWFQHMELLVLWTHRWPARCLSLQCPLTASSALGVRHPKEPPRLCRPCQNLSLSVASVSAFLSQSRTWKHNAAKHLEARSSGRYIHI